MKTWLIYISVGFFLQSFAMLELATAEAEEGITWQADQILNQADTKPDVQTKKPVVQGKEQVEETTLSMHELIQKLKDTDAIGFFTKLAIRSDVLDFQSYVKKMKKKHKIESEMPQIRAKFKGLMLKIMALLEKDPDLSKKIYLARYSILKTLLEVKV